ncbi:DNA repair protein RecO, partial [Candidatus Saccharibacteria bacterium]|nr:DNA repair protein RecO [Candidatus Saccharibacteria bacterium]
MNTIVDKAVVLRRTNYGEADRIVSFLTENNGKITCLAKGVRKQKSKMAGGIEPYCQVEITFIKGRGGMATLTSS